MLWKTECHIFHEQLHAFIQSNLNNDDISKQDDKGAASYFSVSDGWWRRVDMILLIVS